LSAKNFSVVNALPLLEGLELEAKLLDISQPKLGNFYKFLSWIYTPILCDDFFNQSFEINHYINFAQPPELFNSLVDMLNNELWSGSDAQSASDPINSPDKKIKKINSLNAINFLGTRGDNFNLAPADPVAKQSPSNLMRRLSLNSFIPKAKTNKLGSPNRLSNKSKNPAFSYLLDLKQSSESSSSMHDLSISFDELLTEPDIGYFSKGTISESKAQRSYSENLSRKKSMVPGFVLDQKRRAISLNINERYTDLPMPEVADQQLSSSHHKKKGWLAKNFDASKKLHHAK
jgi:hypothetical protein